MKCTIEDVQKLGLRVGVVTAAEPVEKSEKLLKLHIDLGEERRQLVAGIAKSYAPDELIGKQVVVVSNLEPKSLMGVLSNGMILAANSESGPVLLAPVKPVSAGATVQ